MDDLHYISPSPLSPPPPPCRRPRMKKMKGVEEGEKDQFERLPDALVVVIFNKLVDVSTLFRCFSVCKRFASLVPQTDTIFIPIPCQDNHHHHPILVRFQNLVSSIVAAVPFRFLFNGVVPASWSPSSSSSSSSSSSDHDPDRALSELHKFTAIRSLVIELYGSKDRSLGRLGLWVRHKAIIGARFEILVSFFASSSLRKIDDGSVEEEMITRRCLDQALARHRVAQGLIYKLPALCELVFGDRILNGKMCMGKEQIREVRNLRSGVVKSRLISRSKVIGGGSSRRRGVKVKRWHVPRLEIPSCRGGRVMERVTIAVFRREDDDEEIVMERDLGLILGGGFGDDQQDGKVVDEALNVARRQMMIDDHDNAAAAAASIKMHRLEFVQDHNVFWRD